MRIITKKAIEQYCLDNPSRADAATPLWAWHDYVKQARWTSPADIKRDFGSASILKKRRVVFNVAGNKYRLVAYVNYRRRTVYIRFIGTHARYNTIDAQSI